MILLWDTTIAVVLNLANAAAFNTVTPTRNYFYCYFLTVVLLLI